MVKSGNPFSDHGRHVRQFVPALGARHGDRAEFAGVDVRHQDHRAVDGEMGPPGQHVGHRLRRALVGHVGDVDPGLDLEQRAEQMRRRAEPRAEIQLAGVGLGVGDELRDRLGRHLVRHHHDMRQQREARDRREHLERIEAGVDVERGRDRERAGRAEQQRVAIGGEPPRPSSRWWSPRRAGFRPPPAGRAGRRCVAPPAAPWCRSARPAETARSA